ncbi:cholinephosphate cytidylyltransferase [Mycena belliarum]|uniref:choline-phosphate cytidylyltransferase n=1 Tax=Mycena belliarum TaxID=1033014 RepID=A0AAD6TXH9_9AGAR|nr:cholinephosphate cytidylyltransferase [Mycena belliae]
MLHGRGTLTHTAMDASVLSDDSDYDIVSPDNSIADLAQVASVSEPPPLQPASETFNTCRLSAQDIQAFVQSSLGLTFPASASRSRTRRVYVDGVYDGLSVRHALQLRQAKLSFPAVCLVVGVFSASTCEVFGTPAALPDVERCELVRHCRWVDEVLPDAPATLDTPFLQRHRIDYVAVEEGATVDPAYDKRRLKGYDEMKRNGSVILTRRTTGVLNLPAPLRTPVSSIIPPEPAADPDTAPDFTTHADVYGIGY